MYHDNIDVSPAIRGFSPLSDDRIVHLEEACGAQHYERIPVVVRQALGCWLADQCGQRYLDCLAAYSAANPGHHHPRIVKAMTAALQGNFASVISNVVYTDPLGLFLSRTAQFVPQLGPRFGTEGNKVLPKNGGVESVETAIKAARYYGWKEKGIADGRQEIIVFDNNFHGRMTTVISFTSTAKYREGFGPLTPGFVSVPYGDLAAVRQALTPNTCGILVEPMQGEGGMNIPPTGFLKGLRQLADDNDLLLMFDEIQVGLGRTGKNFCFQHEEVVPDGLVLGKALAGGLIPLSVFVHQPAVDGSGFRHRLGWVHLWGLSPGLRGRHCRPGCPRRRTTRPSVGRQGRTAQTGDHRHRYPARPMSRRSAAADCLSASKSNRAMPWIFVDGC